MKITGSAVLNAPVERVWQALNDPAVLAATIPGCERLEEVGQDRYQMTVTAGVASVRGTYLGNVALADQRPPDAFTLKASGAGAPGTVDAHVTVRLDPDGEEVTRLTYDADAVVGGMIGGVGQRMLTGVAKRTAGEFFAAVDDVLTGRAPTAAAAATLAPARMPAPTPAPAGRVPPAVAPAAGPVYEAPRRAEADRSGVPGRTPDFVRGTVVGALIALAGVVVGGLIARRR